jgi:hypothetical protein
MTDEEKIAMIRLLIGDIEGSPFFPLFTDEDILRFLTLSNGNIYKAARMAAISASMLLAGWSTRERAGEIEVWSSLSTNYLKALDYFIKNPDTAIPDGLMPWFGSKDSCSKLLNIQLCDYEDPCGCPSGCDPTGSKF